MTNHKQVDEAVSKIKQQGKPMEMMITKRIQIGRLDGKVAIITDAEEARKIKDCIRAATVVI